MKTLHSHETSFAGLFELLVDGEPVVAHIEIPMIQRDYAQGRDSDEATVIRRNFLRALHAAAIGRKSISLDFVYGEIDEERTLRPLDGQQRLTTLFLLHWFLAARTGRISRPVGWKNFTYATRPSARDFCQRLVTENLPVLEDKPSTWIRDQHWFLPTWDYDPTIQSMLVVIDDLASRFAEDDLEAAWVNLHAEPPPISFHLLPIEGMGSPDALYIRMNSRGRPLTEFENIKAVLEKAVDDSPVAKKRNLASKLDGPWLDLLWPLRDADHKVDQQFLNYLRYIVEFCELRRDDAEAARLPLIERIERAFTTGNEGAGDNVGFLIDAFDTWIGHEHPVVPENVADCFDAVFVTELPPVGVADGKVVLFTQDGNTNLFEVCCRHYDNSQRFSVRLKLLLYAVLLHRINDTPDFSNRLRIVRNLVEASGDERRPERLVTQVADVKRVVVDGDLGNVTGLNQVQRVDEEEKRAFLVHRPELEPVLHRLEDHDLLRGSLVAFELDAARLEARADAFEHAFTTSASLLPLTGALLAVGDYHRTIGSGRPAFHFGAPRQSSWWRQLLTGDSREGLAPLVVALSKLLDQLANSASPMADVLDGIRTEWLATRAWPSGLDWRYYMIKYPAMRSGLSGVFRGKPEGQLGYTIWMLDRENMLGIFRDPYLKAVTELSGVGDSASLGDYEVTLNVSELQMSSVTTGFAIKLPQLDSHRALFEIVRSQRDDLADSDEPGRVILHVPQEERDGVMLDTADRVQIGAAFLKQLVDTAL
jgi:hypothetical protein